MCDFDIVNKTIESSDDELLRQRACIGLLKQLICEVNGSRNVPLTYHVTTFGCQMNARDSEKISGILEEIGYKYCEEEKDADFILYNTCTVRDNANQKLYGHLGSLRNIKKNNPDLVIGLCGCLTQEKSAYDKILESYSFVDLIFGTHNVFDFPRLLLLTLTRTVKKGKGHLVSEIWEDTDKIVEDLPVKRNYSFKSGVNIMFGCNNFCSYCIVPYVRGRERSRSSSDIISEIKRLAADGVKEVMLLGQNVNSYGKGLDEEVSFPKLLQMVEEIEGIERIRFMTSHPKDLSDELIEVMALSKKICRHIHLPMQSGSTRILKLMNRRYSKEDYINLALKIREKIPDVSITTDIIVGFPTETKEDIDDTIDVINKVSFDGAFTFIYSKRTGTPASVMEGQVGEEEVKVNFDRVLKAVQDVSVKEAKKHEGKIMEVLVEDINRQDDKLVTGRLSNNLNVHFPGDKSLIGKIVKVSLDECKGFYFMGHIVKD